MIHCTQRFDSVLLPVHIQTSHIILSRPLQEDFAEYEEEQVTVPKEKQVAAN